MNAYKNGHCKPIQSISNRQKKFRLCVSGELWAIIRVDESQPTNVEQKTHREWEHIANFKTICSRRKKLGHKHNKTTQRPRRNRRHSHTSKKRRKFCWSPRRGEACCDSFRTLSQSLSSPLWNLHRSKAAERQTQNEYQRYTIAIK